MIHALGRTINTVSTNYIRLDLYDKYAFELGSEFSFNPLVKIKSHETNQEKFFIVTTMDTTYAQRYFSCTWIAAMAGPDVPTAGVVYVGNKDFPYGMYDITMWENGSSTNLSPTATYRTIHMGLMSLSAAGSNPTVSWNEYEQDQEQKVYITNEYI